MKLKFIKIKALSLALILLTTSCASSTMITTVPGNAKIYINGEYVGQTPYKHKDSKIVGSSNTIRVEKEGYETYNDTFSKDEKVAVGPLIGGIFLLVPFLWIMKYEKGRIYDLRPVEEN
ncbi:MAG: PEGA domain-containing protein [Maribacter dokdonensis]|uniref:PEGA domain-containing protein n=2 Tax=Maribacter dokdonensis TaxID=320912 RepID=UPI003267BB89